MNDTIIEIKNISKKFASKRVLKGISYSFKKGLVYAILGESGSGKTTLLNIMGLLDNQYEGDIYIDGKHIFKQKDNYQLRNEYIGFVFQSYYLIDYLNVHDNIMMPLQYAHKNNKFSQESFQNVITQLNLNGILNEKVNYLSGGEKQRIAIARAFINNPNIIICDEPTGNLDKKNTINVIQILRNLLNDEKVIIVVTHNDEFASQCDVILELKGGKLYENK